MAPCPLCNGKGRIPIDQPVPVAGRMPHDRITFHQELPCPACPAGADQMRLALQAIERHEAEDE